MEFLVEKVGMSRIVGVPSFAVTLLKLKDAKVCEVYENGRALVAYADGKKQNKAIAGMQKKYELDKKYNRFVTVTVANTEAGDVDVSALEAGKTTKTTFNSKGRGFSGVIKRWNFAGGPKSHGSRFHRAPGSIGNCEWPGRVMKGRKMAGQYGNTTVSVKNEIVSFDSENGIVAVKGSVPGSNGALGKLKVEA